MRKPTFEELTARHGAEAPHAAHVAATALRLFDGLRANLKLAPAARTALEAAARLHDVAYAPRGDDHERAGALLLLRGGAAGLTATAERLAAAAILLHGRDWPKRLAEAAALGLPTGPAALRLAALLRVADALDHGHVQDASVRSVRRCTRGLLVTVSCAAYAGNVAAANRKADLWNRVCPTPIRFVAAPTARRGLFEGLLQPSDRVRDAARRSLALLYRVASDARTATLEGTDPEGLHDFRVTLRRFRAALRFFRGPLSGTDAAALERDLPRLSDRLGPHRDAEVWESFLAREYPDRPVSGASQARRRRARAALAALLRSASAAGTMRRMARLVRVGIPRGGRKPCGPWSARRLHRIYERVLAHGPLSPAVTPEDAHAFRKRVRRARYFAEMSAPILGAPARDLARRFEKLADALGGLHDADVFLARLRRSRRQDSAALEQKIRSFRQARLNEHLLAWERLSRRKFRKQTLTLLEQWERTR